MPEYTPVYRTTPPLTVEQFTSELEELSGMHSVATRHDDLLVLDELFCWVVALQHRVIIWNRETEQLPRVDDSMKVLNRTLKWAWLAREEEEAVVAPLKRLGPPAVDLVQPMPYTAFQGLLDHSAP